MTSSTLSRWFDALVRVATLSCAVFLKEETIQKFIIIFFYIWLKTCLFKQIKVGHFNID